MVICILCLWRFAWFVCPYPNIFVCGKWMTTDWRGGGGKEKIEDTRLDSNLFNVKKFTTKPNKIYLAWSGSTWHIVIPSFPYVMAAFSFFGLSYTRLLSSFIFHVLHFRNIYTAVGNLLAYCWATGHRHVTDNRAAVLSRPKIDRSE